MHDQPDAAMRFATFIDDTLHEYANSAKFREVLHNELPKANPDKTSLCPPGHPHGATTNCYKAHGCRCGQCRRTSTEARWAHRNRTTNLNEERRTA